MQKQIVETNVMFELPVFVFQGKTAKLISNPVKIFGKFTPGQPVAGIDKEGNAFTCSSSFDIFQSEKIAFENYKVKTETKLQSLLNKKNLIETEIKIEKKKMEMIQRKMKTFENKE